MKFKSATALFLTLMLSFNFAHAGKSVVMLKGSDNDAIGIELNGNKVSFSDLTQRKVFATMDLEQVRRLNADYASYAKHHGKTSVLQSLGIASAAILTGGSIVGGFTAYLTYGQPGVASTGDLKFILASAAVGGVFACVTAAVGHYKDKKQVKENLSCTRDLEAAVTKLAENENQGRAAIVILKSPSTTKQLMDRIIDMTRGNYSIN